MRAIGRGKTSDSSTPVLDVFIASGGRLVDPSSLEYRIFDVSTDALQATPVQVYPTFPVGSRAVVDLDDHPAGARLGAGHYAATWTVGIAEPIGRHRIVWYYTIDGGVEQTTRTNFEVLAVAPVPLADLYAFVADMRDEGVASTTSDARILTALGRATRLIERVTRQWFVPRHQTVSIDGPGTSVLFLDQPVIAVEKILVQEDELDLDTLKVYNRHVTQGLTRPDDRATPRIEFIVPSTRRRENYVGITPMQRTRGAFRWANQAVHVSALFGYTDFDAEVPVGVTPELIREACQRLALRALPRLADDDEVAEATTKHRLTSERTRDQSYTLSPNRAAPSIAGPATGDPDIDELLAAFMAAPRVVTV